MSVRIILSLCLYCFCCAAIADDAESPQLDRRLALLNQAAAGGLVLNDGNQLIPGILLSTSIDVGITGPVASIKYTQTFYNSTASFAEGTYVFPLPENAAVHAMRIKLGERLIVGEIKEKAEAKKIYEQAKREGKRAALLQQRKPNLFTSSVANIPPGETVEVELEYSNTLDISGTEFGMRIPMTLTPRYSPELGMDSGDAGPILSTDDLPAYNNLAEISVAIDGQLPVTNIVSASHDIGSKFTGQQYLVRTKTPLVGMDRDYRLAWQMAAGIESQAAFYHQEVEGEHFGLLMVMPPITKSLNYDPARELILIMDTSGSMSGEPIREAKQALLESLRHLSPKDRFNILEFNSNTRALFSSTRYATAANLNAARRFVRGLDAEGGTEMLDAIQLGLNMPGDNEILRQVVFVTDGAIGNEDQLFAAIHQLLGRSRLFTVGIGSAPNSHFMRKAAEFGRGSFVHIDSADDAVAKISALTQKLESPVLKDLHIELPQGVTSENWPQKVPDLFAGEPIMVSMKLDQFPSYLTVKGSGQSDFSKPVSADGTGANGNIAVLWARRKIDALMDMQIRNNAMDSERDEIVHIALQHKLLTRYTSFVAVDKTPVRSAADKLASGQVANLQASGSAYPNTALGSARHLLIGLVFLPIMLLMSFWLRQRATRKISCAY